MELYDIKNLSASAFETSMSFGISLDSFERLAVEVNRINAVEIKTLTAERNKWYDEFSKVENEANALTIERDRLRAALENVVGALAVIHNGGAMYALTPNEYIRCVEALAKVK